MDNKICVLCNKAYDQSKQSPKILKCGHTFCSSCVYEFIMFIRSCPTCNAYVDPGSDFTTNMALIENYKSEESLKLALKKDIWKTILDDQLRFMKERMNNMSEVDEMIDSCKDAAKQFEAMEEDSLDINKMIKEMDEKLWNLKLKFYSCYKPKIKTNFPLNSFPSKEEFLRQIVIELYKKKYVYAFKSEWTDEKIYWAKLSQKRGKLYIHTFSTEQPPFPSLLVSFSDLKKCMTIDNFHTFINIGEDIIICTMLTFFNLAMDFVKYCSGEDGFSFKETFATIKIDKDQGDGVLTFPIVEPKTCFNDDYLFLSPLSLEEEKKFQDIIQIKYRDEKYQMIKSPKLSQPLENGCEDVIIASAVSSGKTFSVSPKQGTVCINDCGLMIEPSTGESFRFNKKSIQNNFTEL